MADQAQPTQNAPSVAPTHPCCTNPSLCKARYSGALTAFTAGVQAKRENHLPAAVGAFQCALTLLQGKMA